MENPSNSNVQNDIEAIVRKKLSEELGYNLIKKELYFDYLGQSVSLQFDLYNKEKAFYGEVYAGIGTVKSGSDRKVKSDILKLISIQAFLGEEKIGKNLVFVDEKVKKHFEGKSWVAKAIKHLEINLRLVEITKEEKEHLENAKERQAKAQNKKS